MKILAAVSFLLLIILSCFSVPRLLAKRQFDHQTKGVSLIVDGEDINAYAQGRKPEDCLLELIGAGANGVAMELSATPEDEAMVRRQARPVFWKIEDGRDPAPLFTRFSTGDGVIVLGEFALENPRLLVGLPSLLKEKRGSYALLELQPKKNRMPLPISLQSRIVKTHLLPAREMLTANPMGWKKRLERALRERSVQVIYFRMSPALSLEENTQFIVSLSLPAERAQPYKDQPGLAALLDQFPYRKIFADVFCLLLPIFGPLLGLYLCMRFSHRPPVFLFLSFGLISILTGVIVYGLGSSYESIVGLRTLRGVKLQLAAPLLLAPLLLNPWERVIKFGDSVVKWKHVALGILGVGILGVLYLSRSGNFPLLPASGMERELRDWMETLFIARPRTKEFLVGHPLMILGLYCRQKWQRGSLLIWLGLIGQISIINTFTHFHTPFDISLLRSAHGLWLGTVLAVPLCYVASLLWMRGQTKA